MGDAITQTQHMILSALAAGRERDMGWNGGAWLSLCRRGFVADGKITEAGRAELARGLKPRKCNVRKVGEYGRTSELVGLTKKERDARIDLGLAIARMHCKPGVGMSLQMLAEFCGCTDGLILMYERNAMKKIRARFPDLRAFFGK